MKSNDVFHLFIKANDLLENAIKPDALNEFPYATAQYGANFTHFYIKMNPLMCRSALNCCAKEKYLFVNYLKIKY